MCGADGHRIFLGCDGSSGRGVPVTNLQLATYNTHIATCSTHHAARNTKTAHCLDCKPRGYRCAYQSPSAFSRLIAFSYLTDCLGRVSGSVCTALSNSHSGAQTKAKQTVDRSTDRPSTHFLPNTLDVSLTVNAPLSVNRYGSKPKRGKKCPNVVGGMHSCCILRCCTSRLSYYCIIEYWEIAVSCVGQTASAGFTRAQRQRSVRRAPSMQHTPMRYDRAPFGDVIGWRQAGDHFTQHFELPLLQWPNRRAVAAHRLQRTTGLTVRRSCTTAQRRLWSTAALWPHEQRCTCSSAP